MSVTVYGASVRCVIDSVQCEFEVSRTVYCAGMMCVSDSIQCDCEVCQ